VISNLRATLDHIIWALVEGSGNASHDKLTFPCVLDRKDWPASLGSRLMNVPPQWIPAIERAQPGGGTRFHGSYLGGMVRL
jgi:hypothetical protein